MGFLDVTCRDLTFLDSDYLEGVLDDDDQLLLELHFTVCPDCVNHIDHLRRTVAAIGSLLVTPLPGDRRVALAATLLADRGQR
jgi:anti-sigma factor RsiW